ncbi:hypothetical protein DU508_02990 [Pedobacter chinensis]|uniref:Uncharacterized protein n=1 Tax=Pedobacter chinensis TaxID=2282421 RepID=A0A369Q0I2_9SPHI|nr:hypothetical protein [Pedobacter chinensis]RDC58393.1 hypothetical protein DU508_02990 [Pedobacter chinensis]
MENNKNNPQKDNEKTNADHVEKTGVIPNSDLSGSDADLAYNEEGEFKNPATSNDDKSKENKKGSDADPDE